LLILFIGGTRAMKKLLALGFVLVLMAPAWAQPLPPAMKPLPPFGKPLPSSTQSLPPSLERQVRSGNLSRQEASDLYEASQKTTPAAAKPTESKPAAAQPAKPEEQMPKATTAPSDNTPKKSEDKVKDKTYSGTISVEGLSGLKGTAYLLESNGENRKQLVTLKDTVGRLNREKKPVGTQLAQLESFAKEKALMQGPVSDNQFSLKATPGAAILLLTAGMTSTEAFWVQDVLADKPIKVSRTEADYWAIRKGTP
jgi:hypothetical protein